MKRIFFGILLEEKTKKELLEYSAQWPDMPCRRTDKENLHATLLFYGNASDRELPEITRLAKETAGEQKSFFIELSEIAYGPAEKNPRMIWVTGKPSQKLISLRNKLAQSLSASQKLKFMPDPRPFSLHITLARLNEPEFKSLELEERPRIQESISLTIPVTSFALMENEPAKTGATYTILERFIFGN
ncbi:MAG: RNA 2',3'-cyclic phosphodiesterase [Candidatus Wildermuthbacteria bacterium]|nr:RNA 2',3'-cyclic phosphodiesterase [Candidatus Wildermuthbacteria bacterium]